MNIKTIALTVMSLVVFASCNQKPAKGKPAQKVETDTIVPVTHTILGLEIGKTTVAEAVDIVTKNGLKYDLWQDENEIQMSITSIVNFGGLDWDGISLLFIHNKISEIFFMEDNCIHTKEQEIKRFETLSKKILQKYPKAKYIKNKNNIDDKYALGYSDGIYQITLEIDECGRGLSLDYGIEDRCLDKVLGSEL